MTLRIWSACCVYLLAWLVVSISSSAPCFADEPTDLPGLDRVRVQLDDPEEQMPGDDDQPTITPRRGVQLDPAGPTSDVAAQPTNDGAATPVAPPGFRAWIAMMRAFMGRIVFVLR